MHYIDMGRSSHNFGKTNLVGLKDKMGPHDCLQCSNCGAKGKRYKLNDFLWVTNKTTVVCPNANTTASEIAKVKINKDLDSLGKEFSHLKEGTVCEVVMPPEKEANRFPNTAQSVWVMGKTEPVRLLKSQNEFTEIKD